MMFSSEAWGTQKAAAINRQHRKSPSSWTIARCTLACINLQCGFSFSCRHAWQFIKIDFDKEKKSCEAFTVARVEWFFELTWKHKKNVKTCLKKREFSVRFAIPRSFSTHFIINNCHIIGSWLSQCALKYEKTILM